MTRGIRQWAVAATLAVVTPVAAAQAGRHVALISIDGLRPAEYLGGGPCGEPPAHLAALMRSGAWAHGVQGVLPSLTYPAHATLVTGVRPERHGVVANARWSDGAEWHFDRQDIHAETLWDAAREAGRSVAIVTWPSTYGALADALVPEDLTLDEVATDRIRAGSTPGLFAALEAATDPVTLLPFRDPEAGLPLDRMTTGFACALVRQRKPALLLMHLLDLDHREHDAGPGSEAACRALQRIDERLGEVRAAYEDAGIRESTAFVVVSDHGFLPVTTMINLPALLKEGGAGPDLVAHEAQGSAALYTQSPISHAARKRIERLHPEAFRWLTADEARKLGGFPGAAAALCARPGYFFADVPQDARVLIPSDKRRGTHGYCPDDVAIDAAFVAGGAGIAARGDLGRIRMIDVAPTVASLLGFHLPQAEGKALALAR